MSRPIHLCALHGFTGAGSDFAHLGAFNSSKWKWTCPDLPGHEGLPLSPPVDCSVAAHKQKIQETWSAAFRENQLNVLLGYSMGGRAALHALLSGQLNPLPHAIILISVNPGISDEAERAKRRSADDELAGRIERNGVSWFLNYWEETPIIRSQSRTPEPIRRAMRARREQHSPAGLAASLRQFGHGAIPDCWDSLSGISVPSLWITGEEDSRYTTYASRAAHATNGTHKIIASAGHAPHFEQPANCLRVLEHWLSQLAH